MNCISLIMLPGLKVERNKLVRTTYICIIIVVIDIIMAFLGILFEMRLLNLRINFYLLWTNVLISDFK